MADRAGAAKARPITVKSRPMPAPYDRNTSGTAELSRPYRRPMSTHRYDTHLLWQGSTAAGYTHYRRAHRAVAPPAGEIPLSADPAFRGDADATNPEQLLVMAASSCQLLSFLAVAARAGVDVLDYQDEAYGEMPQQSPTQLTAIVLRPVITVAAGTDQVQVEQLVHEAHDSCYIANSLNFDVDVQPTVNSR